MKAITSPNIKILTDMFNKAISSSASNNRTWVTLDLSKFVNQEIRYVIQQFLHKYTYDKVAIVFNPYTQSARISVTSKYYDTEDE